LNTKIKPNRCFKYSLTNSDKKLKTYNNQSYFSFLSTTFIPFYFYSLAFFPNSIISTHPAMTVLAVALAAVGFDFVVVVGVDVVLLDEFPAIR
jgi:hypothetical protein